jgi:acyl carrier protein
MTDIAAEVRDILVFHLGAEEVLLTDDARLAEDLGADRLDLVEIAMSCEERFDIDIPNHVAIGLATVGDAVRFVQTQVGGTMGATGRATVDAGPARRAARPRFDLLFGEALHACARLALRRGGSRAGAMRTILMLAVAGLVAFVLQPAGAAAETGDAAVWLPGNGAQG